MSERLVAPLVLLLLSACGGSTSPYTSPLAEELPYERAESLQILVDERDLELHFGEPSFIELFIPEGEGLEVTWIVTGAPLPQGLRLDPSSSSVLRIVGRPRFLGQACTTLIAQTAAGGTARPLCFYSRARAPNGAFY